MAGSTAVKSESSRRPGESPFWASMPLMALTALLFLGAFVTLAFESRTGVGRFPLWSLLFTLGIVAAIGTTISWFYASDDPDREGADSTPLATPAARRSEFGRPPPDVGPGGSRAQSPVVTGAATTAPWDEDVLPPVVPRGPRPVLTTLDDPGEIGRALEEIAEIQRQLAARPAGSSRAAAASARA